MLALESFILEQIKNIMTFYTISFQNLIGSYDGQPAYTGVFIDNTEWLKIYILTFCFQNIFTRDN